jgi:hypothetical protein
MLIRIPIWLTPVSEYGIATPVQTGAARKTP